MKNIINDITEQDNISRVSVDQSGYEKVKILVNWLIKMNFKPIKFHENEPNSYPGFEPEWTHL